jgi:enamine deaminase RidA (YjgF/YER057c/UK114 family)
MTTTISSQHARLLTGTPAEEAYGYCRAIRVGDRVLVSGTTASRPEGGVLPEHAGDTYAQTREVLTRIEAALAAFGLGLEHVIRTNVFFTDENGIPDLVRAHGESFSQVKPVSTAVRVSGMFHPDLLVEIEAEAVAP